MASLTIRKLDDAVKAKLKVRAAENGRSMEEEAREILRAGLASSRPANFNLGAAIRARFAKYGGVELDIPDRNSYPERKPLKFK